MADIVITEFMDDEVARELAEHHDVLYDPGLVDRPDDLARAAKDWATSDRIRNELDDLGVALKDSPDGTTWVRVVG